MQEESPRRHQGAPRKHPGSTQEHPGGPRTPRRLQRPLKAIIAIPLSKYANIALKFKFDDVCLRVGVILHCKLQ